MQSLGDAARALRPKGALQIAHSIWPFAAGIAGAFFLQLVVAPAVGPFYSKVMLDCGINIILAVSLNLVNGLAGQFSIGHAAFMAIGGYTAASLTYYGSFKLWGSAAIYGQFLGAGDLLFLGSCLVGGLVAALFGFIVGLPSLRLRGDYLAIVTLGFGEIIRVLLQRTDEVVFLKPEIEQHNLWSLLDNLGGSLGFTGIPFYTTMFYVFVFVTITLVVSYRIKTSSHGRALLAVRQDEIAAQAVGINTTRFKVGVFVIAAFLAGIAGGLFAHEVGTTLNPRELGFQKSIDFVIMVVLGGMGSISGAVLAAIFLTVLPELLRSFAEYRLILYALILIIVMVVRPQGMFGLKEIWELSAVRRLWHKLRPPK